MVWSEFYWSQRGLVGFALNPNYPADHLKALAAIHTEATPCREAEQSRAAAEEKLENWEKLPEYKKAYERWKLEDVF